MTCLNLCRLAVVTLILLGGSAAHAEELTNTDNAKKAFNYTFVFDACGDTEFGENFRKAILDKVQQCPYTQDAKNEFQEFANDSEQKAKAKLEEYSRVNGGPPETLNGANMSCKDQQKNSKYKKQRAQFARYARGQIALNKVIPGSCQEGGDLVR